MLIPTPPQGKRRSGKSRRVIQPARRGAIRRADLFDQCNSRCDVPAYRRILVAFVGHSPPVRKSATRGQLPTTSKIRDADARARCEYNRPKLSQRAIRKSQSAPLFRGRSKFLHATWRERSFTFANVLTRFLVDYYSVGIACARTGRTTFTEIVSFASVRLELP
jgi:hypothetical protein